MAGPRRAVGGLKIEGRIGRLTTDAFLEALSFACLATDVG